MPVTGDHDATLKSGRRARRTPYERRDFSVKISFPRIERAFRRRHARRSP
jgi:hypothetical protein